jgi:aspartate-semialdehyde dehydrogenase
MRGYRIGVVHPLSSFGARVRELLQKRRFPTIELKLFEIGTEQGSALAEFQGEIVVTQPLDSVVFPHLDLLFFGGNGEEQPTAPAVAAAREGVLTLVCGATNLDAPVMAFGVNEKTIPEHEKLVIAARAPSILIGTVLAALARVSSIDHCCATVLLPAGDAGEEAIKELHQQVVKILNFQTPPTDILQEQIAFNATLASGNDPTGQLDQAVAWEAARLAGLNDPVSVILVRAPIFHGYAAAIWVRFAENVEPEAIAKVLKASRKTKLARPTKRNPRAPTPVDVTDSDKIHVGPIRRDGAVHEGYWLWAVADAMALDPAANAVLFAERALGVTKKR